MNSPFAGTTGPAFNPFAQQNKKTLNPFAQTKQAQQAENKEKEDDWDLE